jgi:hypothetical protein
MMLPEPASRSVSAQFHLFLISMYFPVQRQLCRMCQFDDNHEEARMVCVLPHYPLAQGCSSLPRACGGKEQGGEHLNQPHHNPGLHDWLRENSWRYSLNFTERFRERFSPFNEHKFFRRQS